jgi:hypothetical protein
MRACLICAKPLDAAPRGRRGPKPTMHPGCAYLRQVARWAVLRAKKLGADWRRLVRP